MVAPGPLMQKVAVLQIGRAHACGWVEFGSRDRCSLCKPPYFSCWIPCLGKRKARTPDKVQAPGSSSGQSLGASLSPRLPGSRYLSGVPQALPLVPPCCVVRGSGLIFLALNW